MLILCYRYLVITWPQHSYFRKAIQISEVVCIVVWAVPLCVLTRVYSFYPFLVLETETIFAILFLLPYPMLIFFLGGTLESLCAASSVPPDEKRRIVASMVLLLLVYTLLFLPIIIFVRAGGLDYNITVFNVLITIPRLSPPADVVLCFFLRKGAVDKLLACLCCCRIESNDINRSTVNDESMNIESSV